MPGIPPGWLANRKNVLMTGYEHPLYAKSLSEYGRPVHLPHADGWFLERPVPETGHHDLMGCYPWSSCRNWEGLPRDLASLADRYVSLVFVLDPFGHEVFRAKNVESSLSPGVTYFKEHYIVDLHPASRGAISNDHKRKARQGLKVVRVERLSAPREYLAEWCHLYDMLIARHSVDGVSRFSPDAFQVQLAIPGIVAYRAHIGAETVGMILCYVQNDVAYYHLGATSPLGYRSRASYALFWTAIDDLGSEASVLNLGGGAGTTSASEGLTQFKKGWSSCSRPAYIARHILQPDVYASLSRQGCGCPASYFPAYRAACPDHGAGRLAA